MLTIIIADAEIEFVPEDLFNEPDSISYARRRSKDISKILLDSNYMHTAIDKHYPGESKRRGRPEIIHMALLVALESILNRSNKMRLYIHTRENFVIGVNWETRIPRSYNRFIGLIENLFENTDKKINVDSLLKIWRSDLNECIAKYSSGKTILLSPRGRYSGVRNLFENDEDYTIIIGGFAEGDYRSDIPPDIERISIFNEELAVWTVISEIVCSYESRIGLV